MKIEGVNWGAILAETIVPKKARPPDKQHSYHSPDRPAPCEYTPRGPAFTWSHAFSAWGVECRSCWRQYHVDTPTQDFTCPACGYVTKKLRERATPGSGRRDMGIIGKLTEAERMWIDDGSRLTNRQWSKMHGLLLEAMRAKMDVIPLNGDPEIAVRFELRAESGFTVDSRRYPLGHEPVWLVVESRDGRLRFAERIERYNSDRRTVQAMFLALQSVLARIPTSPRSRLARP